MNHDRAAILSIGDELVLGQRLDTNSRWLAERLTDLGIAVIEHATIPDDLERHAAVLARLARESPLVISTGGLGPTLDDLTREALARVLGEPLVEDAQALAHLAALMAGRGRTLTDLQRTQARRPTSARHIGNPLGTAPGLHALVRAGASSCDVFCLPGPPREMQPMFDAAVVPALRPPPGRTIRAAALHCLGIGEGDLATRLGPLMERGRSPLVGTTASGGIVSIRVRHEAIGPGADEAFAGTVERCRQAAAPYCFGEGDVTIERCVLDCLRIRGERLVVAESCTAGELAARFSATPGASASLVGGWITYSNEMKAAMLGVPAPLIARHGAVSHEVAVEMARGALRAAGAAGGAHHALAVSGIAGPDGGTADKPVGTVFISRASADGSADVRRFLIPGDRHDIRDRSAALALMMLRFHLLALDVPRTLWQVRLDGSPMGHG